MKALELEHDPEAPVIEAIQRGDPHALAELNDRQGRWVRGVVFGVTGRLDEVDDVAQRVWLRVWREARRLKDPARWRPWLYRIARNAATDALRGRRRGRRLLGTLAERARLRPRHQSPPDRGLIEDERHRLVLEAVAALPALYREPFVLKHLEEWSYQEIAEALGLPKDTVETRLVRARRLLRERLAGRV